MKKNMKKNICESKLGIEYIADVLSSCEQNGVQCIVDDANGIFYVYDNREKGNLLYCTSKDIYNGDSTIFDMFRDKEVYNRIMLPGNGDKFKEFCVTWNDLQKKGDSEEVFKTNGCKSILGLTMESFEDDDDDNEDDDVVKGIPNWATCYIMYGDDSGLEDEDIKLVDEFLSDLDKDNIELVSPIDGTEDEFNPYPAFGGACDTTDWSYRTNANANESTDDQDKDIKDKVVRYRWVASSDDGVYEEESTKTFYKQSDCYNDMMQHAIDKIKWNVEWDDVISDCNAFDEDGLIKTDGEMNSRGDQVGGDTWGIYYQLECHPHMIQHLSGSGLYTYKIEIVDED